MNIKKLLSISICVLTIYAQAQTYNFSTTTATYTNLTGSTSLNNNEIWDDPNYSIPIGFNFQYFDTTLSTIYISDAGLGATLFNSPNDFGILSVLEVYGVDIRDRGTSSSLSNISYKLEGVVGDRILKIEWNNVGFGEDIEVNGAANSNFTNFQLWLYEENSTIEIHFGPNSITDPGLVFDGYTGASIVLAKAYNYDNGTFDANGAQVLTGPPSNPTYSTIATIDDDVIFFLDGVIPNGTVYRFTNPSLSINDAEFNQLKLFPNPSDQYVNIIGLKQTEKYTVYNQIGQNILEGYINDSSKIDIQNLTSGLYFIALENGNKLKFIKK